MLANERQLTIVESIDVMLRWMGRKNMILKKKHDFKVDGKKKHDSKEQLSYYWAMLRRKKLTHLLKLRNTLIRKKPVLKYWFF